MLFQFMDQFKVFIVGNSLYSTGIDRILANSGDVTVIGVAPTLLAALTMLKSLAPDVIIVASILEEETIHTVGAFITMHSHIPILRTDLGTNKIQLITSQYLCASSFDLLEVMATLQENIVRGRTL
ncbi:MAG: hypothetical protein FOGNACKC_05138 [Anaerolineae bacterium]|nr:hypothetical protein [Anaerolineae bacterium]